MVIILSKTLKRNSLLHALQIPNDTLLILDRFAIVSVADIKNTLISNLGYRSMIVFRKW